ncbi:MAG: HesA/MoeB/ThiF family protein [Coriobacteriia bacterium]|nr:HesA/MoeB/ThiF family protein [Coriobacteriia bacterium]
MLKRYIRNTNALTEDECNQLHSKCVCVVGCGGLGGYVVEELARIGVLNITVIDCDVFEESNLNRQAFSTTENLGKSKVDVTKERVTLINPDVKLNAIKDRLTRANAKDLVSNHDLVIDCLDNFKDRFWLANACKEMPIIYGAIAGWYGQVSTIFPGDVSFVDIYGSMEDGTDQKETEGNLVFTAATVASIQAAEAVKVLLGHKDVLRNKILMVDMRTSSFEVMELS